MVGVDIHTSTAKRQSGWQYHVAYKGFCSYYRKVFNIIVILVINLLQIACNIWNVLLNTNFEPGSKLLSIHFLHRMLEETLDTVLAG